MHRPILVFCAIIALTLAEDKVKSESRSDKKSLTKNCANSYSLTCLKLDVVSYVDKLNEDDNLSVLPGVSIVKENNSVTTSTADIVADLARDFPNDPGARLDAYMMKKVTGYLNSHSIKLNLFDNTDVSNGEERKGGGGGGGGKKGGGYGAILAAAAMMKGTLMALALGGLAAIAGKALMTGLISLMLSAIIGLKSLAGGGGKQTTYEIVSKPVYTHSQSHSSSHEDGGHGGYGHSSYGRSFDVPLPIGLQASYKPTQ